MNAWILVIMMFTSDMAEMHTVSSYATKERCEEVAEAFRSKRHNAPGWREAICFPKR